MLPCSRREDVPLMEEASKTRRSRPGSEESSMVMDETRGKEPAPMWRNRSWGSSSDGQYRSWLKE